MNFSDRLQDEPIEGCKVSVDGTDCPICELSPFDPAWYSHKINGPAVRYEIALSVETAKIVWTNGPWPCGAFSDLLIFRTGLKKMLDIDEFVVGDRGYADERCVQPPGAQHHLHHTLAAIRARHESLNERLKNFFVLKRRFRHRLSLHSDCFYAVLNATFLMQENDPLFTVDF